MTAVASPHETTAMRVRVASSRRISPSVQRVTFTGEDLARLQWRGFDQWIRLFVPAEDPASLDHVPDVLTRRSYLRLQSLPRRLRPTVRNYTLRAWRPELCEVDVDFVVHGDAGVAGPWAAAAHPGDRAVLIDQGCGWPHPDADTAVLVADETGMPAVLGILRDAPAATRILSLVEVPHSGDVQAVPEARSHEVRWLVRPPHEPPGTPALAELARLVLPENSRHAFAVGESALATGVRRHLVRDRDWAKAEVTFCGYWKR